MALRFKIGGIPAILFVSCLVSMAICDRPAFADDVEKRQVQIDPLSRNFMAPSLEDFICPDDLGLSFEEVRFRNASGSNLRGWFLPADAGQQTILFCMGNTGNISGMLLYAKLLVEGGFNVFLFDYQGYGGSEGIATVMSLHGDAISAFDYLTAHRTLAAFRDRSLRSLAGLATGDRGCRSARCRSGCGGRHSAPGVSYRTNTEILTRRFRNKIGDRRNPENRCSPHRPAAERTAIEVSPVSDARRE